MLRSGEAIIEGAIAIHKRRTFVIDYLHQQFTVADAYVFIRSQDKQDA